MEKSKEQSHLFMGTGLWESRRFVAELFTSSLKRDPISWLTFSTRTNKSLKNEGFTAS